MAITHPTDPRIRGLAAALLESDIPCWEFDLRAVEPGTDPPETSDWHRRRGRANNRDGNIDKDDVAGRRERRESAPGRRPPRQCGSG